MNPTYLVTAKKLVTVSPLGTVRDGAMRVRNGKITAIGSAVELAEQYPNDPLLDYQDSVITPSLVDCHTHLLEFAPTMLFPVTPETHFLAGRAILFNALQSGITALGEQVCGHPHCDFAVEDYRHAVADLPLDITFATTSISIGFPELAHYSAITRSKAILKSDLVHPQLITEIAMASEFPGENIFINATPANFTRDKVPRAGEIIYSLEEMQRITSIYHKLGKRIGAHVAGEEGIRRALESGIDVLHHAHGITEDLVEDAVKRRVAVVATPLGGTHLPPNSPQEIVGLAEKGIRVSISTDAYLPPYPGVPWLPYTDQSPRGPEELMRVAHPAMALLQSRQLDENEILAMLTAHPAEILGKGDRFGKLEPGMDANFLVADGVPGLDITDASQIQAVFFKGRKMIQRTL
ncbi:imidazolonepropionase and related amidohydrolases [Bacillus sp. OxB-1]|uniref:amidohydrolase family protein n=1 Tax=Bacillus sp. (strain OxB-1) TaxID=98228 RepID=UPI00058236A2|nr:amidohydrolase family protein [Bacillus sp. OxB-1]BAQ10694.1 imidazolonepropionase and related amidohydrolases [Bacillus sp. OxB-1]